MREEWPRVELGTVLAFSGVHRKISFNNDPGTIGYEKIGAKLARYKQTDVKDRWRASTNPFVKLVRPGMVFSRKDQIL